MGGSLCGNGSRAQPDQSGELMRPPSIVEMKRGYVCKHSTVFLKEKGTRIEGDKFRKGPFYHPKIECLDTHPARMDTHVYTIYGDTGQDCGRYVYVIDEHKEIEHD